MSLKAFHIVFIVLSVLVSFGYTYWGVQQYLHQGALIDLSLGILSGIIGVGLVIYGKKFLEKLKNFSYL
ncbi:MAG: hypothetical protein DWQ06_12065 [Calditrichaeota bacterium]|nr:MAG: hypothetical protein DWQ06_12065 [Calditrichota bacterium]